MASSRQSPPLSESLGTRARCSREARHTREQASRLRSQVLFLVLAVAFLHGLVYVVALPPWDVIDEEQHLAYALTLWTNHDIPKITAYMPQKILDSAEATDRWAAYHMGGRPESSDVHKIGLEGLRYEDYQPPLYYALLAPITGLADGHVLRALYLARLVGPFLLAALAAVAWLLAAAWFPNSGLVVPAAAGLITASIPTAAAAAGRVNNDLLLALLLAAGLLAATRFVARPSPRAALWMGLVAAAAILTKEDGLLLLPVNAVALGLVWWRGRSLISSPSPAAAPSGARGEGSSFGSPSPAHWERGLGGEELLALSPGIVAGLLVTWWTYHTYGVLQGTSAFLRMTRPFPAQSPERFVRLILLNTWESYTNSAHELPLRLACLAGVVGIALVALIGLRRRKGAGERLPVSGLVLAGVLGLGLLATLWLGNRWGLVPPQGRLIIAIFPVLGALIAGGWEYALRATSRGPLVPTALAWLATLLYTVVWFIPYYR